MINWDKLQFPPWVYGPSRATEYFAESMMDEALRPLSGNPFYRAIMVRAQQQVTSTSDAAPRPGFIVGDWSVEYPEPPEWRPIVIERDIFPARAMRDWA